MTKWFGVALAASLGWTAGSAQQPEDARVERARAEARQVAGQLTDHLRGLLGKELAAGGFTGAVRVCSETALKATSDFGNSEGRSVRRVSLRNRNPKNAPDAYEKRRLEEFARLHREGKLAPEYGEIVKQKGQPVFRYMKPVMLMGMCVSCHGPAGQIPPEVKKVLAERYPKDLATGYAAGDLRGAISVSVPLR